MPDPCRHSADGYVELVPAPVRDTTALDLLRELVAAIDNERADDMTPLWTRARALLAGQPTGEAVQAMVDAPPTPEDAP